MIKSKTRKFLIINAIEVFLKIIESEEDLLKKISKEHTTLI